MFSKFSIAQETTWVEVNGICYGVNITDVEGRKLALNNARSEAVKQVVGVHISEMNYSKITSLTKDNKEKIIDVFSSLSKANSSGRIINETILKEWTEIKNNIPVYKVKIKALVAEDSGKIDPAFKVRIEMPNDVFYVDEAGRGEELQFKLFASQDCYLYLFSIMANDSVQILLPNSYIKNNAYKKAAQIQSFEKVFQNLALEVSLPDKQEHTLEALYVVALKDDVAFNNFGSANRSGTEVYSYQTAIQDIQKWLIQIPRDRRAETMQIIEIRFRKY
jgi:hypothetical protein